MLHATLFVDANILYKTHPRNLLLACAADGLIGLRASERVLFEAKRAWMRHHRHRDEAHWDALLDELRVRLELVDERLYQPLVPSLALKDPDDVHVLAAALASNSALILTENLRDFKAKHLRPHGMRAVSSDELFYELWQTARPEVQQSLHTAISRPLAETVQILKRDRLFRFAKAVTASSPQ
jgi:predicted nucleic acid-binding protein